MFCRKISPDFKLINNLLFINENLRTFHISLIFNNFESANFYSNKIYVNDILISREKCNVKMNKIICLIKENLISEKRFSDDIYINVENSKKFQKGKKIYYVLRNLKNNLYLEFLSKEKYFIKILNQLIEPFDNLSKFEIENFDNPIKIHIYDSKTKNKIGKIKEKISLNYIRFLENSIGCGIIGESIQIKLPNTIQTNNINNVMLTNSNENSYSLVYKIYKNILTLFIPNNINKGHYSLQIKSNNEILYSQNFKLYIKLLVKEKSLHISNVNLNEPIILNNLNEVDDIQEFYFGKKDEKPEKISKELSSQDSSIIIKNSKILLNNFSITDPLSLYYFYGKNICNDDLYILVPIYINSEIIKSSVQELIFNKSTIIQYILNGTYAFNSIEGGILRKKNDRTIIYKFDSNNIRYIDKTNNNYTVNITFNLTGFTNLDEGIYELYFLNFGEYILQKEIIYIIKSDHPLILNKEHIKYISCKEQNKYYSYTNKSCINKCNKNEYYYNSICYINCPDNTYKFGKECINSCENYENEDLKEIKGECIQKNFILNNISPTILLTETGQIFNLTFEENIPDNNLFNVKINNSIAECNRMNKKIFACKINLSSPINNSGQYKVYYSIRKRNNYILNLNSNNISITINPNSDICDKFNQIYNNDLKKCEDCSEGTYYYNKNCINNCKDYNYYVYENNSKLICIKNCDYKIEHRNSDNYCVKSCSHSEGYGYLNNSDEYNCYKCKTSPPNITIKDGICVFGVSLSKYRHLSDMKGKFSNRTLYDPDERCEKHPESYFDYSRFQCIECPRIDPNMIKVNGSCVCNPSKYVLQGKKCVTCKSRHIPIDGKCVCDTSKYIYNYHRRGDCTDCYEINSKTIFQNGTCVCDTSKYGYNFYGRGDCTNCYSISEGMILENGKCVCNSSEYIFNSTYKDCFKCSKLGEGMIPYNGSCQCDPSEYIFHNFTKRCFKCSLLSEGMIPKDGNCVCDSGYEYNLYGNKKCTKCSDLSSDMIEINGKCECVNRTYKVNIKQSFTCSSDPCKTYNPCKNNGTCDFINNNYVCTCNDGYFGIYCDSTEVSGALNYFQSNIYSSMSYKDIISNHTFINLIKQISSFFNTSHYYCYSSTLYPVKILTISAIDDFINNNYSVNDDYKTIIIEYIGLTLYQQNCSSSSSILEENEGLTLQKIHLFYKKLFSEDFSSNLIKNKIISSTNKMFFYILWDFKNNSYYEYISTMDKVNASYINRSEISNVDIVLHTIVNPSFNTIINIIKTTLYDNNKNEINDNFILIVSFNLLSRLNNKYYFDYLSKGINIYNFNDPAFTDECYNNKKFKHDITNYYRKEKLYHHINSTCIRQDIKDNENLYFLCRNDISFYYQISKNSSSIKLNKNTRNLSFKCITRINGIKKNIAFWIYFPLTLILIIAKLLSIIVRSDYTKGEDIKKNDEFNNMICITQTAKIEDEKANMQTPIYIPKSFLQSIKFNISHFHPLICIFYRSILSPSYFNIWLLIFNISNLFGLNALFYNEKLIYQKIFDGEEDTLVYPIIYNYIIIIESIITSMILTFVIKLINLISFNTKNQIAQCFNIENEKIKIFEKKQFKKRIVAEIIMLILYILMFICSCGFCYMYFYTQRIWLYTGIWSLILIWIILSPLFIFILSIIEFILKNEKIIYYMKRLLCF